MPLQVVGDKMSIGKNLDFALLLEVYGCMLTKRQQELMEYYYWEDMSLGEISENFGITRQAVRDSIKRGEQTIIQLEEKLGLAAKISECRRVFNDISVLAKKNGDNLNQILKLADEGKDIF